jgi:ring-1,2-phenylacetyl-CoA epoxidase subunit PaaA
MVRICKEESFHQRQGFEIMCHMMAGTKEQQAMAQDAMDRWWWPSLMMFGPHDSDSPRTGNALKWKIKRETNDELRMKFVNKTIPQAEFIGLNVPDPDAVLQADGTYKIGQIDWNEFWAVVKGNGPCNAERLEHHIAAHKEGKWVREAAKVYREKQVSEKMVA